MKPRILIVADVAGWALDRTAENIIQRLSHLYDFEKVFNDRAEAAIQNKNYDLLYITYWRQFQDAGIHLQQLPDKSVTGIRSHFKWDQGKGLPPSSEMIIEINQYRAVHVPSKILYDIFKDKHPALYYTPHGVDQTVFKPAKTRYSSPKGKLVVGWAGSKHNHPGKRGLEDLLIPALNDLDGVTLKTAAREDTWRTQYEMVDFYRSLDVYICTSRTEGGPHPLLEAASCAIPVISTPVGLAPELIINNQNGLFIDRTIPSIQKAITFLRDHPALRYDMGQSARKTIEKSWNWDIQSQKYIPFFNKGLA